MFKSGLAGNRAARADQLLEDGDPVGAVTWHRILDAIERLQAQKPAEGGGCSGLSLSARARSARAH